MKKINLKTAIFISVIFSICTFSLTAQVTIGSGLNPADGALLDLKQFEVTSSMSDGKSDSQKGINLPRVALQDPAKLEPCVVTTNASKSSHIGLTVYNTTMDNILSPGIYYWSGEVWIRMVTEIPKSQLNIMDLQRGADGKNAVVSTVGAAGGTGGIDLNFGTLVIPEDGSYAFSFRLYGAIQSFPAPTRCVYYLSLWGDGAKKDIAEINLFAFTQTGSDIYHYTYSVTLGGTFTAGQSITFKMSHPNNYYPWSLIAQPGGAANKTSLIWWRL